MAAFKKCSQPSLFDPIQSHAPATPSPVNIHYSIQDSSVGIVMSYGLDGHGSVLGRGKFSLFSITAAGA
jgi:hypothetical protein